MSGNGGMIKHKFILWIQLTQSLKTITLFKMSLAIVDFGKSKHFLLLNFLY